MSIIAHAPAAVNVASYTDAALMPGSTARILATGRPALYDAIHAEYVRRGLDGAPAVLEYEPSALDLELLHGDDHDAQPGDPDDLHVWSVSDLDWRHEQFADECDWDMAYAVEMREVDRVNREVAGYAYA